jgi:asparagine synthase (glutamine-hydrolysing)
VSGRIFAVEAESVGGTDIGDLILKLYERQGTHSLGLLNGYFGLALWDKQLGSLVVGRDHLGIEPLFYAESDHQLVCGTSAAAVAAFHDPKGGGVDETAIGRFLCFNYNPGKSTFWRGVNKFPAAHSASLVNGRLTFSRYWKLSFARTLTESEEAIADRIRHQIEKAVSLRARDLQTPAVFVSGGLDSSTVLGVLSRQRAQEIFTYSYRCRGEGFDESHYARMMADSVRSRHQLIEYSPEDVALMADLVGEMNEPFCDVGINIATALLGREAAKQTRCVLTGDAGDELFAGHPVYEADKVARYTDSLPAGVMTKLGQVLSRLPDSDKKKTLGVKLKRFGESLRFPRGLRTNRWRLYYLPEDLREVLQPEVSEAIDSESLFADILETYSEADAKDPLGQTLYSDYFTVVDFYLRRNDLNRSLGLETRYPFLDIELVELCAQIPSNLKIRGWFDTKYIMKKAVEPWLPREIVYREDKLGHSIPMKNWIRDNDFVRDFVGDILASDRLKRRGLVNASYVRRLWDDHMTSQVNNSHRLWTLAVLELWLEKHNDATPSRGGST